jgi:quercetin dioxygenase-like cupin family protein
MTDETVAARAVDETVTVPTAVPSTAPTWARREELPSFSPAPGITAELVSGGALMTVWMRIEPETSLAVHHHRHEQIGVVLEGAIEITIGGETRRVGSGGAYVVPSDVPHGGVTGSEGCLVLESFAPPRESFLALVAAATHSG